MTDHRLHSVPNGAQPTPLVKEQPAEPELRSFLHVVYRALMMVARYLEKTYNF